MNLETPTFRQHKTGVWMTRWGGQDHYFTVDREESYKQYLDSLKQWAEWRAIRSATKPQAAARPVFVADLVERFLDFKELEGGPRRRSYYRNHLRRFNAAFGTGRADLLRATHLHALKEQMMAAGFAPKTINHDISVVKTLMNWAVGMELVPPVNLSFVKALPVPPGPNKAKTALQVKTDIDKMPMPLQAWLAVNFLTMMRPTEVVRVINQQGVWEEKWLFRLHHYKTELVATEPRRIVFSDEALSWLEKCEPRWSREDTYYQAAYRAGFEGGPHHLRHSGATCLAKLGVDPRDIDLLLGHLPPHVGRCYGQIDWQRLRPTAALLSLRSSGKARRRKAS